MTQGKALAQAARQLSQLAGAERGALKPEDLERITAGKESLLAEFERLGRELPGSLGREEAAEAALALAEAGRSNGISTALHRLRVQLAQLGRPKAGPPAPRVDITH